MPANGRGRRAGRAPLWFLLFGPVLFVALGVAGKLLPLWSLVALLAVPLKPVFA
jgi:1,4-dihydroxy-2-naphthoate octaprenyltransferase